MMMRWLGFSKKKSLNRQLTELESDRKRARSDRAGDDDLPYHKREDRAQAVSAYERKKSEQMQGDESGEEDEDVEVQGNDFYEQIKAAKRGKKEESAKAKEARRTVATKEEEDLVQLGRDGENRKRGASKAIMQNRGLMKYRDPKKKNPRVANKIKAGRKEKKAKNASAAANMRTQETKYDGEASGIRKNIVKSHKYASL